MNVQTETLQGLADNSCWELKDISEVTENWRDIGFLMQPEWRGLSEYPTFT